MTSSITMNLFLLLCQLNTLSATVINGGTITTDYTFSLPNSPYIIAGIVDFTGNVYIENGVEIIYSSNNAGITIKGNINAGCNDIGTTNYNEPGLVDQATFTHIYGNLSFYHGTIRIESVQYITNEIKFCNVKFSKLFSGSGTSSNCLRVFSFIGDKHLAFYNNIISHCGTGLNLANSNYYVSNNLFTNIHHRAIDHVYTDIVIIDNVFKNSMLSQILYLHSANLNATIMRNTFINNIASDNELIYIEGLNTLRSYALIKNNILINNQASNRFFTVSASYTDLINNKFRENVAASISVVVDKAAFYFSAINTDSNKVTFLNNNFQGNTWNAYFVYTDPERARENIFEYNIFNEHLLDHQQI